MEANELMANDMTFVEILIVMWQGTHIPSPPLDKASYKRFLDTADLCLVSKLK